MILTFELFELGKSSNNGWNNLQLKQLGIERHYRGWIKDVIGKDFSEDNIKKFIEYKDCHLNRRIEKGDKIKNNISKKIDEVVFVPVNRCMAYKDQYLHPNWQKMRLFVFQRDKYACVNCKSAHNTLHVHHLKYLKDKMVWEVPHWYLVTLCDSCHKKEHNIK